MKKLLLLFVFVASAGMIYSQYEGSPWYGDGNPWMFGTDSAANLRVGQDIMGKNAAYNGVPHSTYDIGVVDTLIRPAGDPNGTKVAGSGVVNNSGTNDDYRTVQANNSGVVLTSSDQDAIASPNYGAMFTSHQNRGVTGKTGGWYRYSCIFAQEGNYRMVLRMWGNNDPGYGAWIRIYDKATMDPLYPWTKFHPGKKGDDTEGVEYVDVSTTAFDTIVNKNGAPKGQTWVALDGAFTLDGDVVVEYSDVGPSEEYGDNIRGAGSGNFGEFTFMYTGPAADEFAPVAEVWRTQYDDMHELNLSLSEDGTLYLVDDTVTIDEAANNNLDMMEMTTNDVYTKVLNDTNILNAQPIRIVTMDDAGNGRITAPISIQRALTVDTTQGNTGDTLWVNTTRAGFVALVPSNVEGDYLSLTGAVQEGNADTINVTGGLDSLVITNLTGDMDCKLYLFDTNSGIASNPIDFQLGEGGSPIGIDQEAIRKVTVAAYNNQIMVNHNDDGFTTLQVFDLLGKQLIRQNVTSRRMTIDASQLNSGIYILRMTGTNGSATKRFLLRK